MMPIIRSDEIRRAKVGTQFKQMITIPDEMMIMENYHESASRILQHYMHDIMLQSCHIYKIEQIEVPSDCMARGTGEAFEIYFIKMGMPQLVGFKVNPTHWGFT